MNLTDLKTKPIEELLQIAENIGLENMARNRKQDVIFTILKRHAKSGEDISGEGVLEILQDGFGFLRSSDSSYLAGPDDIYVSPARYAALTCAPAMKSLARFAHPKKASVILHC
jgi:transcription termination factor Rho